MATAFALCHCSHDLWVSLLLVKPVSDHHFLNVACVTSLTLLTSSDWMMEMKSLLKEKEIKLSLVLLLFAWLHLCIPSRQGRQGAGLPSGKLYLLFPIWISRGLFSYLAQPYANKMRLDKSTLIHRWRCTASRALSVTNWYCLQCQALLEVIIIDLLND